MRIAVYAISKNEAQFVERFCQSAADADLILIADTGSTDGTVELARQQPKTVVHNIFVSPWRFDKARDTALALLPADIDVCISLDLDEVLEPGWREEIERVWNADTTRLRYKFDWGCGISFYYEKIHHRKGYHWWHPVHEYPRPDGRTTEVYAYTDKLLVSHHPDPTKSRGQYLDLLRLAVKEDPHCPRNAFYFARELTFYKLWGEAVVSLHKYLDNPQANWPNERCYAMRLLGQSYEQLGAHDLAEKWHREACKEAPQTREPWIDAAEYFYRQKNWQDALEFGEAGLKVTRKEAVYTMNPDVWGSKPFDIVAISAYNLGLYDKAYKYGAAACELSPDDKRLERNLTFYREKKNEYAASEASEV